MTDFDRTERQIAWVNFTTKLIVFGGWLALVGMVFFMISEG